MNDTAKTRAAEQGEKDYSATLFLPDTDFPMRAGLPEREPILLKRWEELDIFARQRAQAKGRPLFTLHDGPPYANGNIHIGHALNKTLKDLVSRSMQMLGYDSSYIPGWDCHGLPIEWKVEEQYREKGKNKDDVPLIEFRAECRDFARHWIDVQRDEFKRLGVLGDWSNPYLTMSYPAEAQIARELMKVAASSQLYRGSKPVMWSVVERTALAEAEIEYQDYESDQIWVKFPVTSLLAGVAEATETTDEGPARQKDEALAAASVCIWTTTPWTIPGNRAISFSEGISYSLFEVVEAPEGNWASKGERLVVADKLAGDVFAKAKVTRYERLFAVPSATLKGMTCAHPLRGLADGYAFDVPLLEGEHVTDDTGTGFVHTAPSHGTDDFDVWVANGRLLSGRGIDTRIPFTVDDAGYYTGEAPGFEGARVIDDKGNKGDANRRVIEALIARGMLVARGRLKHQYPHSWRSKKPIIFRNTPQWFVHMDRDIEGPGDTLRKRALDAIERTRFYPPQGQNRLRAMIAERPDWVLSRQRAWGVPIAVFYNERTGAILKDEAVNRRIADAFEAEGADAWFRPDAKARFLGNAVTSPGDWTKIDDILDVWFESGTTHAWVLRNTTQWSGLRFPASMYLEGSDQHRGWFHSSLLESCATNGFAPYESVLTHGFTMDAEGRKMSKSLGNVVVPQEVIRQYGADILRLWVASVDYSEDQRLGREIINTTVDSYRKLRNSLRWMLGNLAHHKPEEDVPLHEMPELERLMLHRLAVLDALLREAYAQYDYKRIVAALSNFMNIELSAFYFDIRKDALYCDPISSLRRRASLTVLDQLFECLTAWLAPILVFTSDEAWLERHPDGDSVHLRLFPAVPAAWRDDALAARWEKVREVRRVITGALEIARKDKVIGSSLEAAPKVFIADAGLANAVAGIDLAEVAITSAIAVDTVTPAPADAFRLDEVPGVAVVFSRAEGRRCARSWKVLATVGTDPEYPDLSPRDADAMRERRAAGLGI